MMLTASRKYYGTIETIHHSWVGALGYYFDMKKVHTVLIFSRSHLNTFGDEVYLTLM